ncbi:nuclear factor of activated T-cells, cytoplasmic 2 [Polymixia lowei]
MNEFCNFPSDDQGADLHNDNYPPTLVVHHPCADISSSDPTASIQPPCSYNPVVDHLSGAGAGFDSLGLTSRPGIVPAPSPRIEITPSGDSLSSQPLDPSPSSKALGAYREQPCVSPASSNSSTGWPADTYSPSASPCISPSGGGCGGAVSALDLCLQEIRTSSAHSSPGASPHTSITDDTCLLPQHRQTASPLPHQRSRSVSPKGKRAYDHYCSPGLGGTPIKQRSRSPSPIPSTHEQQVSYYPHHYQAPPEPQPQAQASSTSLEEVLGSLNSGLPRVVLSKMVEASKESCVYGPAHRQDFVYGEGQGWSIEQERRGRAGPEVKPDTFYIVPTVWPPPYPARHAAFSGLPTAALPSLEWPLPSQFSLYELLIHQQPRSHHRAHYETEGSRGPVKTPSGGHPEVQLLGYQDAAPLGLQVFIGTADERILKPHAFYQVHRITGKTVTTPSMESMVNGTKVLEIPLEPKNHMRALIDCTGILKLRNADIELRNGETDIGRKNTRVRLVFRVHIPQPGGQFVSLQVASHPIECSQRSAQESPTVERQDLDRCSVLGGPQMLLTGQNFTSDSKVMFSEKTQDGQQLWEVEATVDRDKTQPNMLFVEVPPYRDPTICHPAKVNFYVINGKKKRSQPQHFIYTPLIAIKAEPLGDYPFNAYGCVESQSLGLQPKPLYYPSRDSHAKALNVSSTPYRVVNQDPEAHRLTPQFVEDQSVYYPSRASALNSSPVLYHTANQHHSNSGAAVLRSSPAQKHNAGLKQCHYSSLVSHLSATSNSNYCVSTGVPVVEHERAGEVYKSVATLSQSDGSYEACLVPRYQSYVQTVVPLGKSPPSRYFPGQAPEKQATRADPGAQPPTQKSLVTGSLCDKVPEKITVKQENLNHAYLEDVNDIIRRDLKTHSDERS